MPAADDDADDAKATERRARSEAELEAAEEMEVDDETALRRGRRAAGQRAAAEEEEDDDDDDDDDESGGEGGGGDDDGISASGSWQRRVGDKEVGYDGAQRQLWLECELPLGPRPLLVTIVERIAPKVRVRQTAGISGAVVVAASKGAALPHVQTAGVNFEALAALGRTIELNTVRSNDIYAVLQRFGVEAARATIVEQIRSVFDVYGIKVDPRHLGLIADYMTHEGGYTPLNRSGIESCASPLLKMSFETTAHFLKEAAVHGDRDGLASPSAAIVLGKPPKCGTGAFELKGRLFQDGEEAE